MQHRQCDRVGVPLHKTIPVRMRTESGTICHRYVRFLDLSEGGLKLSGDLPPPDEPFSLEFNARLLSKGAPKGVEEVHLKVEARWQKDIYGDMWVGGFQFLEADEEQDETIRRLLQEHNGNSRPRAQLEKYLNVGLVRPGRVQWYYPLVSELDAEHIELQSTEALPLKETCQLALSFKEANVVHKVDAVLELRHDLGSTSRYRFTFKNPSERLQKEIQRCLKLGSPGVDSAA